MKKETEFKTVQVFMNESKDVAEVSSKYRGHTVRDGIITLDTNDDGEHTTIYIPLTSLYFMRIF